MSQTLSGKVQYLRGLADGLNMDGASKEGKLLLAIIDALDEFAKKIDQTEQKIDELDDVVGNIEEDMESLDEILFGEDEWDEEDDDWDEEDDEEDQTTIREINDGGFIEYECPHCRSKIYYDAKGFDLSKEHICPDCGKELFPEDGEEE